MAKRLQHRGGTTSQHSTFTGAVREVTVDTDKNTLVVHDGATAGGHPLATATNFTSTGIDDNATSTAITINSGGNLGINNTNPTYKLDLVGSSNTARFKGRTVNIDGASASDSPRLNLSLDGTDKVSFMVNRVSEDLSISNLTANDIIFSNNSSENMRIDGATGNVGIGTSSPASKLTVSDTNTAFVYVEENTGDSGDTAGILFKTSPSNGFFKSGIILEDDGTSHARGKLHIVQNSAQNNTNATVSDAKITILNNGNVGIGTSSPEEKLDLSNSQPQNIRAGSRTYLGAGYSTGGTILGHTVKAKISSTDGASPMETIETNSSGGAPSAIRMTNGRMEFHTADSGTAGALFDSERMRITNNGDISFYEDTGTTPKFFWDASTERLGIGTSSLGGKLHVENSSGGINILSRTSSSGVSANGGADELVLENSGSAGLTIATGSSNTGSIYFADSSNNADGQIQYNQGARDMRFATAGAERIRLNPSGKLGIGLTNPTQPLQVEGIALSKPKLGMSTFGGGGAPNTDRERARQGLWRASSDRGSFILNSPVSSVDYAAFTTGTNNSYIVWDLLVTNCSEILVRILYANSADNSGRTCVSEFSTDGGSNYTQLGTATFNAGSGDCGGTISFGNTSYQNQTYVKIRTAFTSGAPPSSVRNYIGIKEVFFTPLCSSVSYQKCLG